MPDCCKMKHHPRSEEEIKKIKNRLHRIVGQMNGVEKMIEENRYCGDILIQISAIEKSLQSIGYQILEEHLKSCVVEDIQEGKVETMDEVMKLMKNLK
ncbi:MAG: metal-sensing transcriptional repressor [Bacillota bacterium]|nr:metal-sensing transcriptional repressor [Bacillota bacterium]